MIEHPPLRAKLMDAIQRQMGNAFAQRVLVAVKIATDASAAAPSAAAAPSTAAAPSAAGPVSAERGQSAVPPMYRSAPKADAAPAEGEDGIAAIVGPQTPLTPEQTTEVTGEFAAKIAHENIEPGSQPGYFLTPAVRTQALRETETRVTRAGGRYDTALSKVEFKQLLKKEDESSSVLGTLVLGAVFGNIGAAIGGAVGSLKSVEEIAKAIEEIGGKAAPAALKGAAKAVSEKEVEAVVGTAVDVVKDKTKEGLKGDKGAEAAKEKSIDFLEQLAQFGTQMFDLMSDKLMYQLDDGQLLAFWRAMDDAHQSEARYIQVIEERLKLFMGSQAASIGRTNTSAKAHEDGFEKPVVRETRVAFFATREGRSRLAYVYRDFDAVAVDLSTGAYASTPEQKAAQPSWSGTDGRGATSYADAHVVGDKTVSIESLTSDDVFGGLVEPSLVETALKRHEETWRYAPRRHVVPDYVLDTMETWGKA